MQILNGNNLDLLKTLPDNSVDSVVTDPPYGLSFMNKKWDYDVPSIELWKEVYRVLKHGGHVLSFGGTRTYHRMVVNMEDAGFEIRDQIMWLYGSGFPKSHNIGKAIDKIEGNEREVVKLSNNGSGVSNIKLNNHEKGDTGIGYMDGSGKNFILTKGQSAWEGWGTALKPANEPICLARKPLSEKSVAENVLKYGTGGINIDGSRIDYANDNDRSGWFKSGSKGSEGFMGEKNFAMREHSAEEIQERCGEGRFPANIIFDEEAGKLLDEQSGESKSGLRQPNGKPILNIDKGWNDNSMIDKTMRGHTDKGGASRFFYCAKASKSDRNDGCEKLQGKYVAQGNQAQAELKRGNVDFENGNKHNKVELKQNFHPTVKPTDLMRYLCRLITPPNGIVLDPFMGSGSTGKGAILEGFDFIGMELDPEYVEIAKARIEYAQKEFMENQSQQKLF
jgi:site-specific DNA-methyltransferase (adenine-specific)